MFVNTNNAVQLFPRGWLLGNDYVQSISKGINRLGDELAGGKTLQHITSPPTFTHTHSLNVFLNADTLQLLKSTFPIMTNARLGIYRRSVVERQI